jgi:MFS family permease
VTNAPQALFTPRFFLMCGFTFTVFLSLFQLLPTAPYRILELGGDTSVAGLFLGFLTYASALSAPFTGALADRIGRRRVLVVTSLAISCFSVGYLLSTSTVVLLALVLAHGVFWSGLLSASSAHIMGLIPASRRAEGIAYWGMATVLATAFAPAAGLWIFHRGGWMWLCVSILVLNLLMAGIAFALEESRAAEAPAALAKSGPAALLELIEWRVFVVSICLFLCSFGHGGVTSFVALYAERNGIEPRGIYFISFSLTVLLTRPFSGRFADRVGHRRVLVPCLGFVFLALALLSVAHTRARMMGAAALMGLGFGNVYPVFAAHVMKHVDESRRGAAFGGILAALDTGIGTGSIVLGWTIGRYGFPAAFALAACLSALAIPAFLVLEKRVLVRPGP